MTLQFDAKTFIIPKLCPRRSEMSEKLHTSNFYSSWQFDYILTVKFETRRYHILLSYIQIQIKLIRHKNLLSFDDFFLLGGETEGDLNTVFN